MSECSTKAWAWCEAWFGSPSQMRDTRLTIANVWQIWRINLFWRGGWWGVAHRIQNSQSALIQQHWPKTLCWELASCGRELLASVFRGTWSTIQEFWLQGTSSDKTTKIHWRIPKVQWKVQMVALRPGGIDWLTICSPLMLRPRSSPLRRSRLFKSDMMVNLGSFEKLLWLFKCPPTASLRRGWLLVACFFEAVGWRDVTLLLAQGEDVGLDMHSDSSDVTVNVCLGRNFLGAAKPGPTTQNFCIFFSLFLSRTSVYLSIYIYMHIYI